MTTTATLTALTAGGVIAVGLAAAPAASAAPISYGVDTAKQSQQSTSRKARVLAMKRQIVTLPGGRKLPLRNFHVGAGFGHSSGPHAGREHAGLDLAASSGTPIFSTTNGKVVLARSYYGYGNLVMVKTSGGGKILYAHQSRILVKKGQRVRAGERIGKVGSTGHSTGPHLHFEVRSKHDNAVNPLKYLGVSRSHLQKLDRQLDRLR